MEKKITKLTTILPHPALLVKFDDEEIIVISDLHIGWENSLSEKGIHVPSQTGRLLERITKLVNEIRPNRLVILGDIKNTVAKIEYQEWNEIPCFFEEMCKLVPKIQVIPGNHDGNLEVLLPQSVSITTPRGISFGDVGLLHGHTWPDVKLLGCRVLIMGHVHPVVLLKDPSLFYITRQVWMHIKCNGTLLSMLVLKNKNVKFEKILVRNLLREKYSVEPRTETIIIMPSFNDFLGGHPINKSHTSKRLYKSIGPILRSECVDLIKAETYLLDGTYLGQLDRLRYIT